jgi:alpha-glucosidase/alpha-D-xyloside xylohydrolase
LHGSIPAKAGEVVDSSHIQTYWKVHHEPLVKLGVDAFWPDEGDWFNLFERISRHQLYYQGHLSTNPNVRPWSLQRNGYPGIAQWGGWVWSGDTESTWKTLEAQIAVGINYSMSIGPFWGSDIGGFYSTPDMTGEMFARWVQFGAFCASFRSHGRPWMMHLPWGWGGSYFGPLERPVNQLPPERTLFNKAIEPVAKQYVELRYQLLPYNYTLAWEARNTGLPMMRAMWMHYPKDATSRKIGDQYLWGKNMLIAPVYEKDATSREVYLPEGVWYDWWTNQTHQGGRTVTKEVDLSIMPIYVPAGAIVAVDPIRQYTAQAVNQPTTLKVYSGVDGSFTLYDDDGISQDYLSGKNCSVIDIKWDQKKGQLSLSPAKENSAQTTRKFIVELIPGNIKKEITFSNTAVAVTFQ